MFVRRPMSTLTTITKNEKIQEFEKLFYIEHQNLDEYVSGKNCQVSVYICLFFKTYVIEMSTYFSTGSSVTCFSDFKMS